MKILRLRTFSKKYRERPPFKIPTEWDGKYDSVRVVLRANDKLWEKELNSLVSEVNKDLARKLKKSLKSNPNYLYEDDPNLPAQNTHQLTQFSTNKIQVWSKDISPVDRMVYDVHEPVLDKVNREVLINILICNLSGHKYKGKTYSEVLMIGKLKIKL